MVKTTDLVAALRCSSQVPTPSPPCTTCAYRVVELLDGKEYTGCDCDRICERLAAYEDSECEPEEVLPKDKADEIAMKLMRLADLESLCSYARLRELAEADKDGRVAVLPCKPDGLMLNTSDPERPEIMKRIHFAVAYVCGGIVFHQPYNIFLENIAAGYIRPLNEADIRALEAMKDE